MIQILAPMSHRQKELMATMLLVTVIRVFQGTVVGPLMNLIPKILLSNVLR